MLRNLPLFLVVVLPLLAGCGVDPEAPPVTSKPSPKSVAELKAKNAKVVSERIVSAGQPTLAELEQAKALGFTTIVNLRAEGEDAGFDEKVEVEKLGMTYVRIPMKGLEGVTVENMETMMATLGDAKGHALVHCASGNRCGALFALAARVKDKKSVEDSLVAGKNAGLTKLEEPVRKLLETLQ